MKQKINEVREYFKAKILAGEFEFIDSSMFNLSLNVDGYRIPLYYPRTGDIETLGNNGVFYIKFTEKESNTIRGLVSGQKKAFEYAQKLEQLEQLKKELEND